MLQINKKTRLALRIDLVLQAVPLIVIIISLIASIFEKMILIIALLGLAVLGIVQVISVFCFIAWLNDMVRVKYLIACFVYGILFITANSLINNDSWAIAATAFSLLMALFYFWHSWRFYKKTELSDLE